MIDGGHEFKTQSGFRLVPTSELCEHCGISRDAFNRTGTPCRQRQDFQARDQGMTRRRDGSHY